LIGGFYTIWLTGRKGDKGTRGWGDWEKEGSLLHDLADRGTERQGDLEMGRRGE